MFNSFKASFEKEFGYDSLKVKIHPYLSTISWPAGFSFQEKIELPKHLCHLTITPVDWAVCAMDLGFDVKENIKNLRYIWEIEKNRNF